MYEELTGDLALDQGVTQEDNLNIDEVTEQDPVILLEDYNDSFINSNDLSISNIDNYDLTTLESLIQENNDTLHSINDNMFRLYYFVGGLYVVFMIIIVIKFFKQFF